MKMKKLVQCLPLFSFLLFSCGNEHRSNNEYVTYVSGDTVNIDLETPVTYTDSTITYNGLTFRHKSLYIDSTKYYVVEGDLLLNENDYFRYKISFLNKPLLEGKEENKLVGMVSKGKPVKWNQGYIIRYAVIKKSFQNVEAYNAVVKNMHQAIAEWEHTCGVKFLHDTAADERMLMSPTDDLTFVVLEYDAGSAFIASSFFPNTPATERRLLIDPSYYSVNFDKAGVLRHELGHVLGFRHEHIRGEAPSLCPDESLNGTVNLTSYDAHSVMHYFCGGEGSLELKITDLDIAGSQSIYGKPL